MKDLKQAGILRKYIIAKADGSPIDDGAEYFVLRLDYGGSDPKHIEAGRKGVIAYAKAIKKHLPKLSEELLMRYDKKSYKTEVFGQQGR